MDRSPSRWHALSNTRPTVKAMHMLLESKVHRTGKSDNKTNIINQADGSTYEIPIFGREGQTNIYDFFDASSRIVEVMHFSERQYFETRNSDGEYIQVTHSCFELDIDKYQSDLEKISAGTIGQFLSMLGSIFDTVLDMSGIESYHVVQIGKEDLAKIDENKYKQSFHLRIFLKLSKEVKAYLLNSIVDRGLIEAVFQCDSSVLDKNSVSYPVMLYNSAKKGSLIPHKIMAVFDVRKHKDMWICKQLSAIPKSNNWQLELSVNYENPKGFIKKPLVNHKIGLDLRIKTNAITYVTEDASFAEQINIAVDNVCVEVADADFIREILLILKQERCDKFDMWKQVLCILARHNPKLKPLAVQFSMRSEKWSDSAMKKLDELWAWAINNNDGNGSSIRMLYYFAREDDKEMFEIINAKSAGKLLHGYVMKNGGDLSDEQIATLLYNLHGRMFVSDSETCASKKTLDTRTWYQFVTPEAAKTDLNTVGPYKWRNEGQYPDDLDRHICNPSGSLYNTIELFISHLETMASESSDADEIKFYNDCKSRLKKTQHKLGSSTAIRAVMQRCSRHFRTRGFCDVLDKNGNYIGVLNGVLQLKPRIEMLQHYHEIPISRTANAHIVLNIETDDMTYLESEIRRLFADDEDAFIFCMCFLAATLDGSKKEPLIMIWLGMGSNGKSFLLELHINTLRSVIQNGYAAKLDSSYFTKEKHSSGGTDTETVMLKNARFTYTSETKPGEYLLMVKLKQLLGETMSANDKYKSQDMFEVNSLFVICSNYDPCIEGSDWGTWRRLLTYTFKMKFTENPDPMNRFEWKNNSKLLGEFPKDPRWRNAYFGLLVKWYHIFQTKYGGLLANIPKPTIDKETTIYRSEQDPLSLFMYDRLYPEKDSTLDLVTVADAYQDWVKVRFGRNEVRQHIISKFKKSNIANNIVNINRTSSIIKDYRWANESDNKDYKSESTEIFTSKTNKDRIMVIEKLMAEMGITDTELKNKTINMIKRCTNCGDPKYAPKTKEELEREAAEAEAQALLDYMSTPSEENIDDDSDELEAALENSGASIISETPKENDVAIKEDELDDLDDLENELGSLEDELEDDDQPEVIINDME